MSDPNAGFDRLDSYGKWLFTSAAVIGSLGAGFSNSAFSKLRGAGIWLFAFASLAPGLSLVAASRSVAPHWINPLLNHLASLPGAVKQQFSAGRLSPLLQPFCIRNSRFSLPRREREVILLDFAPDTQRFSPPSSLYGAHCQCRLRCAS